MFSQVMQRKCKCALLSEITQPESAEYYINSKVIAYLERQTMKIVKGYCLPEILKWPVKDNICSMWHDWNNVIILFDILTMVIQCYPFF